jgi:hypothetical protein
MNKPTDLCEIIVNETDDYDKFPRKKLIKTYTKYNNILKAFRQNKLLLSRKEQPTLVVLSKFETKLIDEEIDNYAYKFASRDEAKRDLLKFYVKELTDAVNGMKILIDALHEEEKPTHYACECGSNVVIACKARHLKSPLHLDFINQVPKEEKQEKPTHYVCACGSSVVISHKSCHLKTQLHLDFINNVPPKPKAETTVHCGCDKIFSLKNKSHHDKTKYHLDWVETLPF